MTRLIADIGGTHTRCAIVEAQGQIKETQVFMNEAFDGLEALLTTYIDALDGNHRITSGRLAVAAPILGDAVKMINIDWQFSIRTLQQSLGLDELQMLNDFEALATGLPAFTAEHLFKIGSGEPVKPAPKAVLGPGTGLGVASLIPDGDRWIAVGGEGGHVTLPASNPQEAALIKRIHKAFGHCSAERLISGPGLELLHATLHDIPAISAADIAGLANAGNPRAQNSLNMFFELLGTVASNLALTIGAFGGIYIGGGIVPKHLERFSNSGFRDRFEAKGRYGDYLQQIPTYVIVEENPTLLALASPPVPE
ncbi:MAG: glucokinase [Gammaproteobacteria bacterium]|nr:glucokinase [Gammaproteobacteria bacterium]